MSRKKNSNLSRKQAEELLREPGSYRVPELDIAGGLFEAYQLSDGRVLMHLVGEGGHLYDSREELETWRRESQERKAKYLPQMAEPVTIWHSPEARSQIQVSEDIGRIDWGSSAAYSPPLTVEQYTSGADESFQLDEQARDWLLELVRYYRPLGFFQSHTNSSDDALAQALANLWAEDMSTPLDPSDPYIDLHFLKWDEERVWWHDTEADVCVGNEVYAAALEEWSDISQGVFIPEAITETWETETGPIWIDFTLKEIQHRIQPQYLDDWIDLSVLNQINHLIEGTGYRFEAPQTGEQMAFVTVLSTEDKIKLQRERGWQFES